MMRGRQFDRDCFDEHRWVGQLLAPLDDHVFRRVTEDLQLDEQQVVFQVALQQFRFVHHFAGVVVDVRRSERTGMLAQALRARQDRFQRLAEFHWQCEYDRLAQRGNLLLERLMDCVLAGEPCFDGCEEIFKVERFDDVITGSQDHPLPLCIATGLGGQEDQRDHVGGRIAAQRFQHAITIQVRHQDVAHNQVRQMFACQRQSFGAVACPQRLVALKAQHHEDVFK